MTKRKISSKTTHSNKPIAANKAQDMSLFQQFSGLVGSVKDQFINWSKLSLKMAGVAVLSSEQLGMLSTMQANVLREAGHYLQELRELTGLTINELANALDIEDKSVLDALEQGTATLSFELILRMASILARHDPFPFVLKMVRTYDPEVWEFLTDWGVGKIPLQYERERSFVNILRSQDKARELNDEAFASLLALTESAFNLGLNYLTAEVKPETTTEKKPDYSGP